MAKIRVYELARDLNMTNKALLEKIQDTDVEVKSHMSSLEGDDVERIKAHVLGKDAARVEEKRVKPTVIRRRRKPSQLEEQEAQEAAPETDEETAAEPAAEPETPPIAEAEVVEAPEEEAAAVAPKPTRKKAKPEKAKVIAPPPEESAADKGPPVEETTVPIEAESADTQQAEEADAEGDAATEPQEAVETDLQPEIDPQQAAQETKPEEPAAKQVKRHKKDKKHAPAKIIKLPTAPVAKPEELAAAPTGQDIPAHEPSGPQENKTAPGSDAQGKDTKRQKKKKRPADTEEDKKFLKKKISFRKKAVIEGQDLYDEESGRGRKGKKGAKKQVVTQKTQITTPKAIKRRIKIDDAIILSDLSKRMGIKANEMIQKLMGMGVMATVNQTIDYETASLVAAEFGYEVEKAAFEEETILAIQQDDPEKMSLRPPVVTIMGHVDHGKTSLLDVIRKSSITNIEAGGITQHIGAYNVQTEKGQIVFLDTPGHEAFTAMRSRGAQVTDIVILVVAADDGVMPQTIEAINHAKAANVPMIVAINKIDKEEADPDRVKRELAEHDILAEDWGGDTIFVNVSAKKSIGIDDLLEMILLQAEVLELKANPDKRARGYVIEAKLDSGRGPVATVLVQEGTLHVGESLVCGIHAGKVRAMLNDQGEQLETAGPSIPVEVLGLNGVPSAGDELVAVEDERSAKQVSEHRMQRQRSVDLAKSSRISLEGLFEKMAKDEIKGLNIIIKADVHGSIEALKDSLNKLSGEKVKINVVHSATGTVNESDISLATVSEAIIIGFNVRPSAKIQDLAAEEHVDMRFYDVIYNVIKDIKDAMLGLMESTFEERILGRAEVRDTFIIPKRGTIAGCYVTDGKLERGQRVRLLRDGIVVYDGKIGSLRRFKDDAKEVPSGYECGAGIENFNDIKINDILECYFLEEIKPTME